MESGPVRLAFGSERSAPLLGLQTHRGVRPLQLDGSSVPKQLTFWRILAYCVLTAIMTIVVSVSAIPRLTPVHLYSVQTGSMVPALPVGSITMINTAQRTPKVGAIVAFRPPMLPSSVYTHRVTKVLPNGSLRTSGDALHTTDPWTVPEKNVIGTLTRVLPYASWALATMKIAVIIALAGCLLRFGLRRVFKRTFPAEYIAASVLSGSLYFLFNVLRPLFGGSAAFVAIGRTASRVDLINTGWLPFRAYSAANPRDVVSRLPPNSATTVTMHFHRHSGVKAITSIHIVPAPTFLDIVALAAVVLSPLSFSVLHWLRRRRRTAARERRLGMRSGGGWLRTTLLG
jgi:signal peptidase I